MLISAWLLATPAEACGGFFCDQTAPVLQAAERIVFGIEEGGVVEMHVQIAYEGPAEQFAWIVPVPEVPDLFLTTSALFTQLAIQSQPQFTLQVDIEGECSFGGRNGVFAGGDSANDTDASAPPSAPNENVDVLAQEVVGPYETVTLAADDAGALLDWLQLNGYELPDTLDVALAPYVADGAKFVALKLAKDRDDGDLAPLAMRYAATQASIPVQLTAVNATPDMRLEAYVLGEHRAVPESYLHVKINPASIDWWTRGSNYADVITQAAGEAGAHAFATDFAGDPARWADTFDVSGYDGVRARASGTPDSWVREIVASVNVRPMPAEFDAIIEQHIQLPEGVTGAMYAQCPDCWEVPLDGFDPDAATTAVEAAVIDPLRRADELVDRHRTISRMTSSLSPVDMDVDPVFALNPDMPREVTEIHTARLVYECLDGERFDEALRRLELEDGRAILLPGESWFAQEGITEFEYIEEHGASAAIVIERTGAEGDPEVVTDHLPDLMQLADAHNADVRGLIAAGCGGCASPGSAAGFAWLAGALVFALGRRRR